MTGNDRLLNMLIEEISRAVQKHGQAFTAPIVKTTVLVNTQRAIMRLVAIPDDERWAKALGYLADMMGSVVEEIGEEYYQVKPK